MIAIMKINLGELKINLQIPLISSEYFDLAHIFLEDVINTVPKYRDHNLYLETMRMPSYRYLYNLSQNKLEVF